MSGRPSADRLTAALIPYVWPGAVAEFRFHPSRRWRFDFAWPDKKLAVEIEGGTWSGGRHTSGKGYRADCEKYSNAAIMGWAVIRVTTDMLRDGTAAKLLDLAHYREAG